jgi:hypothetical protein
VARFSCAAWRPIGTNIGTGTLVPIGALMHQQVGDGSLYGYFNNPAAQVSAHFWVAKSGLVEQYVDTDAPGASIAWHAKHLNGSYVGVECEGYPDQALTSAQLDGFAAIMAEGNARHGWPLMLVEAAYGRGLGYHRMTGGVNTACPSQLRVDQRAEILIRAGGGDFAVPPTPEAKRRSRNMIASTDTGNGYWCVTPDGAVYTFGDAVFAGQGFDPDLITGEVVGIAGKGNDGYWLFASDGGVLAFGSAEYMGRPDRFEAVR